MESIDLIITATNEASKTLKDIQKQIRRLQGASEDLDEDNTRDARRGIKKWRDQIDETVPSLKKLENATEKVAEVSAKMLAAGLAAGAAAFFPIKQAAEFEKAMQNVRSIMTTVTDQTFERMKQQARELGETTKFTATQSAEAFKYLAQAGLSANDAMQALPGTLQLAAAGGIDLATAADLATNVLAGLGLQVTELSKVNDVLAKAAASANTSVQELGDAMKIAGPAAKGTGIEIENVVAVLGGLANAGIKGAEGGNAVKRMLILLQNPTKKARVALSEMGVEVRKADGTFRGLIPVLQDLNAAEMTLSQSAKIFGLYTGAAAVAASNQAYEMDGLEQKLLSAAGAAEQMAISMEDNLIGAFTKMGSAIEGFWLAIAEPLLEPLKEVIEVITSVIGTMTSWVKASGILGPAVLGLVIAFSAASVAAGVLGIALAALMFSYKNIKLALIVINPAMMGLTGQMTIQSIAAGVLAAAWTKLGVVMAVVGRSMLVALLNPYVLLAAMIVTVIALMIRQNNQWKRTKKEAEALGAATEKAATSIGTLTQTYHAATEGSEKQRHAAEALQKGLLKVAEENEGLAFSAIEAAKSIDIETGALLDGGEALRNYNVEVAKNKMQALGLKLLSLEQKLKEIQKIELWTKGFGDKYGDALDATAKKADNAKQKIVSMATVAIQRMVALGEIDPSLGIKDFTEYIRDTIPGATDDMVDIFRKAYIKVTANRLAAEKQMIEDLKAVQKTELQMAEETAQKRADALKKVTAEYDKIKKAAKLDDDGGKVGQQIQIWKEREVAAKQYVDAMKALAEEQKNNAVKAMNKQNEAVDALLADGVISAQEAEGRKVNIALEAASKEVEIKEKTASKIKAILGEYSKEYAKAYRAQELARKGFDTKSKNSAIELARIQKKHLGEFSKEVNKTFKDFEKTVTSAYSKAKQEVEDWSSAVRDAEKSIADSRRDTAKTILELEQSNMTATEEYASKRQEAERLSAEAIAAYHKAGTGATQEELDNVREKIEEATSAYAGLAGEVTEEVANAAGEMETKVIHSQEKTVASAIAGIKKMGELDIKVLEAQENVAKSGLENAQKQAESLKTLLNEISAAREVKIDIKDNGTAQKLSDKLKKIVTDAAALDIQLKAPEFKPLKMEINTTEANTKLDAATEKVQTFTTYISGKKVLNVDTAEAKKKFEGIDKVFNKSSYLDEKGNVVQVYTQTAENEIKDLDQLWDTTAQSLTAQQIVTVSTDTAISNMKKLYEWAKKALDMVSKVSSKSGVSGDGVVTSGGLSGAASGLAGLVKNDSTFKNMLNMKFKPQINIPAAKTYNAAGTGSDLGTITLGVGAGQYPVQGETGVLEQLKMALMRENLVRVG